MSTDGLPEDWDLLRGWLPKDLNRSARQYGFFSRARGLQDAEVWLRLVLMHVAGGLSLEMTVARARELGLAQVSAVALFKRLARAENWLRALCGELLGEQRRRLRQQPWPLERELRVIDATDVQEPGSTGTKLRLHYCLGLPGLACEHYEITDHHGGEKLGRFHFAPGQWVLVDRGYSHRAGVAQVLEAGAQVLLRWNPAIFPLENADGSAFDPLAWARALPAGARTRQRRVYFRHGQRRYALRLCARRQSKLVAERARRRARDKARRNQTRHPDPDSLELHGYLLLLTSIPTAELPLRKVLELYGLRWQIELSFKRLKSLLHAGHVPKSNDASAKSWMQAKLLSALLMERILLEAGLFSPWGYPDPGPNPA